MKKPHLEQTGRVVHFLFFFIWPTLPLLVTVLMVRIYIFLFLSNKNVGDRELASHPTQSFLRFQHLVERNLVFFFQFHCSVVRSDQSMFQRLILTIIYFRFKFSSNHLSVSLRAFSFIL
jgi:hypothetical protein